ncbi:hypothetical protein G5V58_05445 [Nocardioides anomalus]|uniref:Uncharacterized protein n=1 Tax=Nocardioides anomalus TaxID=2712223 RepID=A0A6G6WAV7_9ACTN|nr:hypothetical protein [Nocardioides anomalus]QIG42283.1 hypothetical protein G5V58_05445 [Nocardioides anomalus]
MPGPHRGPSDDALTNAAISAAMAEDRLYGDSPATGYKDGNTAIVHSDGVLRWADGSPYDPPFDYSATWDSWRGAIADLKSPWEDRPAAGDFYDQVQALRKAAELLRPGPVTQGEDTSTQVQAGGKLHEAINTIMGDLAGMDSNTIRTFRAGYADRLETINAGQFGLTYVLGQCVAAESEVWARAGADYLAILGQGTQAFLGARDYQTYGGGGGGDMSTELTVAGAILSGIGIFATGGLSTVVGIGSLGVGLLKDFAPKGSAKKPKIGGGSANAVLKSLQKALDDLRDEIAEQEQAIAKCLNKNLGVLHHKADQFDLKSPGMFKQKQPHPVSIKVDQGRMRFCGTKTCVRVAKGFKQAAAGVQSAAGAGPWTRPAYFGASTGPYPAFADLLAGVEYAAANTAYEITTAGHLLAASADYYDEAENSAEKALKKIHKLLDHYEDGYPVKPDYDRPPPTRGGRMAVHAE